MKNDTLYHPEIAMIKSLFTPNTVEFPYKAFEIIYINQSSFFGTV